MKIEIIPNFDILYIFHEIVENTVPMAIWNLEASKGLTNIIERIASKQNLRFRCVEQIVKTFELSIHLLNW